MCTTNLNAKEKRLFQKTVEIKNKFGLDTFQIAYKIITAEQNHQITETIHTAYKNFLYNDSLFIAVDASKTPGDG